MRAGPENRDVVHLNISLPVICFVSGISQNNTAMVK